MINCQSRITQVASYGHDSTDRTIMLTVLCYADGSAIAKLHSGCEGGARRRDLLQDAEARLPIFITRRQLHLMDTTCCGSLQFAISSAKFIAESEVRFSFRISVATCF